MRKNRSEVTEEPQAEERKLIEGRRKLIEGRRRLMWEGGLFPQKEKNLVSRLW